MECQRFALINASNVTLHPIWTALRQLFVAMYSESEICFNKREKF